MSRDLRKIAELSDQLADRFSMVAEPLRKSSVTLRRMADTPSSDLPQDVVSDAGTLAGTLPEANRGRRFVEELDGFQADAVVGQILDLTKRLESHTGGK